MTDTDNIEQVLAYLRSPEGMAESARQAAREARWPRIAVTVPETLVGQFTAEFEALRADNSPWVKDTDGESETALTRCLLKAREVALRLDPDACRALYEERNRLCHKRPTDAEGDRVHEIHVLTEEHPISLNLCIAMLVCDARLDGCGYPVADWLPGYVRSELQAWKNDDCGTYGQSWVDAALNAL